MTEVRLRGWSASQLKQVQGCKRRWAFNRVLRLEEPQGPWAAIGTAIHEEMELFNNTGTPPLSKEATGLVKYAPTPGIATAEVPIDFDYSGVKWIGFIDLAYDLNEDGSPAELGETGTTVLLDWKTVSGYTYALTQETLPKDPAANIYAHAAFEAGARRVILRWIYMPRGTAKGREVSVEMDAGKCSAVVADLSSIAHQANLLKVQLQNNEISIDEVPIDTESCYAFGSRCPRMGVECKPHSGKGIKMATKSEVSAFYNEMNQAFPDGDDWAVPELEETPPATQDTPVGAPERGFVNPVTAPPVAQLTPEDEWVFQGGDEPSDDAAADVDDGLEAMDLEALREIAKGEGAEHAPKARKPGVIGAIRAARMLKPSAPKPPKPPKPADLEIDPAELVVSVGDIQLEGYTPDPAKTLPVLVSVVSKALIEEEQRVRDTLAAVAKLAGYDITSLTVERSF